MGMAASQARLLQLTSRNNDIGYQLEGLSLQKTSLTRDMQRVTKAYQEALNSKTLKWSNNSGVTYYDLTYANLMRPSAANGNKPYLLTDSNGKIVLDSTYEKYAQMFSPDGNPSKNYQSKRAEILSDLIPGLSVNMLNNASATTDAANDAAAKVNALQEEGDKLEAEKEKNFVNRDTADKFWDRVGNISLNGSKMNGAGFKDLGKESEAKGNLRSIITQIKNGVKNKLLKGDEYTCFEKACTSALEEFENYIGHDDQYEQQLKSGDIGIKGNKDGYKINMSTFQSVILSKYQIELGKIDSDAYYINEKGNPTYVTVDYKNSKYTDWENRYKNWEQRMAAAKENYKGAVDTENQALNSSQETQIRFYDKLFTAISENGWVADSQVEDTEYLNNMLQNNMYYISTVQEYTDEYGKSYNDYSQDIASNFDNIFTVSDSDYIKEAEVAYAYEKSVINEKEARIDARMKNLETEQAAIKEMIKGIEAVEKNNIETNFGIFA